MRNGHIDGEPPSGSGHLPPFGQSDLPAYPGRFWKLVGPGAVLLGLSIGAGELIIWPSAVGRFGTGMLWAAGFGILLQVIINLELARYTLATGETAYTGFARIWRGFAAVFILLNITSWILPGWARSCGEALRALVMGVQVTPQEGGPDWLWTAVTFVIVALVLFGPRMIYRSVELSTETLIVIAIVGLVILAAVLGMPELWLSVGRGTINVGHKEPEVATAELFSWIVFAGAGGTANLFYCFYLRDKNMGMGARIPVLTNILRDREPRDSLTGFRFQAHPSALRQWRLWWRHAIKDQLLFFWLLNSVTIFLFVFTALAVVYPMTLNGTIQWEGMRAFYEGTEISFLALEAVALGRIFGPAQTIFLLVAVAALLSTQLTVVDGVARSISDLLHTNYIFARRRPLGFWYATVAIGWIVMGCILTYWLETSSRAQGFLFVAGFSGGLAMAIYCPLIFQMNRRFLPQSIRPGKFMSVLFVLVCLFYLFFAVYSIIHL